MGWNDRLNDGFDFVAECDECHKKFQVSETEQIPGFRDDEPMICPYCGHIVKTSREYEYCTYKIEEKNDEDQTD